ncbi:MAG: isoprenylcysteine carboxylmethyltransferase family protein [candidate division Zixibacteria bacterium]|nr:isoprenylcysteine carboxylmethyltransferase family protein [candidate division Zixibacteria bacterium]
MSLREKAIEYLSRAAADRSPRKYAICALAPIVFFTLVLLAALGVYYLGEWLELQEISSPVVPYVAYPLIAIGMAMMVGSVAQFLLSRGTPVPISPPPTLVTSGLYRLVRNPMFAGLFVFLAGLGLWLGSVTILFIFLPLLISGVTWEIKAIEEPELERRFGQMYRSYRECTPMFLPRLDRLFKASNRI